MALVELGFTERTYWAIPGLLMFLVGLTMFFFGNAWALADRELGDDEDCPKRGEVAGGAG